MRILGEDSFEIERYCNYERSFIIKRNAELRSSELLRTKRATRPRAAPCLRQSGLHNRNEIRFLSSQELSTEQYFAATTTTTTSGTAPSSFYRHPLAYKKKNKSVWATHEFSCEHSLIASTILDTYQWITKESL